MYPRPVCVTLHCVLLALLCQQAIGLVPEPRIDDKSKYSLNKQYNNQNQNNAEADDLQANGHRVSGQLEENSNTDQTHYELPSDQSEEETRITMGEPYKSIIQTTTRFFIAQTSVTNYVNVDTFMDVMSDAGYALSKPSILMRTLKAIAILVASVMATAFFIPLWTIKETVSAVLHSPDRLLRIERYLPNGLNEMGIIGLLNEKTEELLARFGLNEPTCRELSVCQAGELVRCTFPKASKVSINFISENFSRPKYRSHKYLNAFLSGFIDQNCANSASEEQQANMAKNCAANFIKSLASCPKATRSISTSSAPRQSSFQTIRVAEKRAR